MLDRKTAKVELFRHLAENERAQSHSAQFSIQGVLRALGSESGPKHEEADALLANELLHELYLDGVIMPGTGNAGSTGVSAFAWPFYRVTAFGWKAFDEPHYPLHDPDGYLKTLSKEIPDIDDVILRYLDEGLQCLKARHYLAAAVMIGAASEKAMLLLIESFGNAIRDPDDNKKFKGATKNKFIAAQYKALWEQLKPIAENKRSDLPYELRDGLDEILSGVFRLIRQTRNDAGHPQTGIMERDVVDPSFQLFHVYCRRVYGLIDHFKSNPPNV